MHTQVGLGWGSSLANSNIRSSSDIADEISLPIDYPSLQKRNAPDVQVCVDCVRARDRGDGGWGIYALPVVSGAICTVCLRPHTPHTQMLCSCVCEMQAPGRASVYSFGSMYTRTLYRTDCANSPQVYDFAREMQALDVLLFNFISLLDKRLGLQNLSTAKCGYVSLDKI